MGKTLKCTGFSPNSTASELKSLFLPFGTIEASRLSGRSFFVDFSDEDEADDALDNLNNFMHNDCVLLVEESETSIP